MITLVEKMIFIEEMTTSSIHTAMTTVACIKKDEAKEEKLEATLDINDSENEDEDDKSKDGDPMVGVEETPVKCTGDLMLKSLAPYVQDILQFFTDQKKKRKEALINQLKSLTYAIQKIEANIKNILSLGRSDSVCKIANEYKQRRDQLVHQYCMTAGFLKFA